ncbi:hypothetical protein PFISCL1PPCAC_23307, partial [Pristionchus fissidentatus]
IQMTDTVQEIRVKTKDNMEVTIPLKIAEQCGTIRNLLEAVGSNSDYVIPLPNVSHSDMLLILAWLQRFPPQQPDAADELQTRHNNDHKYRGRTRIAPLERRFFEALPTTNSLFGMLNSAMYLDIPSIAEAGSGYVAEKIKDMTVEEARAYMNMPDDQQGWEVEQMKNDLFWINKKPSGSSS